MSSLDEIVDGRRQEKIREAKHPMVPMRQKRQLQDVEATVVAFSLGVLNGPFSR